MKKLKKMLIILIPLGIIGATVIPFLSMSMNWNKTKNNVDIINTDVEPHNDSQDIYKDIKIFPDISQRNFYQYLRISEVSNNAIITDEMIARIIKYIIKNMNISKGKTYVGYKRINDTSIKIQIKWSHIYKNKIYEYSHTYKFITTNSI